MRWKLLLLQGVMGFGVALLVQMAFVPKLALVEWGLSRRRRALIP